MNGTAMRQAVASALGNVPDVRGFAYRPGTPAPGDVWPLLSFMDRAQGDAFVGTWRVRVLLPQDEEAASVWMDAHWDDLYYALKPLGYVQRMAPVLLAAAGGDLYALEITMIAEE